MDSFTKTAPRAAWFRRWTHRQGMLLDEAAPLAEDAQPPASPAPQILALLKSHRRADNERALVLIRQVKQPAQRRKLREELRNLLESKDFAPSREGGEESPQAQIARGWLLSALTATSEQEPDATVLTSLERHLDRSYEPVDWVRFWALAGLYQAKHPQLHQLAERTLSDRSREPRNLVRNLAVAILASLGDLVREQQARDILQREADRLKAVQDWRREQPIARESAAPEQPVPSGEGQPDKPEGAWEMLRALRVIPVVTSSLVNSICDIVEKGEYTDATYEALFTLGELKPQGPLARNAAQALEKYLSCNPWPSHDTQREAALRALGKLGTEAERSAGLLIEHLLDDNPSIVRAAACSLEQILGTRRAVHRVQESCLDQRPVGLPDEWGRALQWMNRQTVAETLDATLASGSEDQQKWARDLLRSVGGPLAFEKLHGRTAAMERYFNSLAELETKLQEQLNTSLQEARIGFIIALMMDVIVFLVGLALILSSASLAYRVGDLTVWSGAMGATGVAGVLYSVWIAKPREKVRQAVDDLAHIKFVFLAYLRQLHQVELAYTRRLLESQAMLPQDLEEFRSMVTLTLEEALRHFRIGVARAATAPTRLASKPSRPSAPAPREPASAPEQETTLH